jgi:hypothetical protein
MPRKYRQSRTVIHNRTSEQWDQLTPLPMPVLTPGQIRQKRLELAQEMLGLLLGDDGLGTRPRQTLERVYATLGDIRRQL